jgi:hypothetical protein
VAYTADDLLTEVRRGGSLPSASVTGTADADLLAHADAELRDTLVPLMLGVQEEFYQRVFDTTIVTGTAAYRINKRAALSRINTVQWINGDGSGHNLPRLDPKRVLDLGVLTSTQGQPTHHYLEGSRVVLWPTPNLAGTLRIRAFVRPSRLCLSADSQSTCLVITAINQGGPPADPAYLRITTAAHGISTSGVRDLVLSTPSFEHACVDATMVVNSATAMDVLIANCSTTPAIGDYLCVSDLTPMIQLPVELHPALVELTIARTLRALGKRSEAKDHADEAERLVKLGIEGLTPREDSAERKIVGGPHYRRRGAPYFGAP